MFEITEKLEHRDSNHTIDIVAQYTIHIVDDCEEDSYIARRLLSKSKHVSKIIHHSSATQFFDYMEKTGRYNDDHIQHNSVLILDMHMPDMNGLEALKIVRSHPLTEDIPTVMLSGDSCGHTALAAYNSKADAILQKPLDMRQFNTIMDNL